MGKGNRRHAYSDGIAVIGIAARFPGADDYTQFWDNLKNVRCSVSEVPAQRWDAERYYSPASDQLNKSVSKWGGFIDGVDLFDSMFFGISPREARAMDPQQRIALELAWACIEDAGYAQDVLRGSRTGVYLGVMNFDYRERLTEAAGAIAGHMSTGAYTALIANRLSYFFDWHGPSMPIDTACSSSLVALHEAVHALRRGDCEQALVGGVSVLCSPTHYVSFSKTGMLSPDGLCRSFDDRANGYVRGEGAGLALLKPVQHAIRDGDRIYGVVRGTAVNHGGKARTVTYPNPLAQADVIASAHERAGFEPGSIGYVEAHGTGTPKGDPIEISGLKAAFARLAERFGSPAGARSCGLGSLKANVGHLEPVAGIAGLIKVLLAMQHRTLPGLAHFQQLNHRIDLSDSPFYIVEQTQDWPARLDAQGKALPRRAGVSSFGFGGVNAHAVIEEFVGPQAAARRAPPAPAGPEMVLLSARAADRLHSAAHNLLAWLQQPDQQSVAGANLADIAYTLQVGRTAMEYRLAIAARSIGELSEKLGAWLAGESSVAGVYAGQASASADKVATPGTDAVAGLAGEQAAATLALWVKGHDVDWNAHHGAHRPRRIGLPTYPFARKSHWLPAAAASAAPPVVSGVSTGAVPDEALLYFEEDWIEQALIPATGRQVDTVLCFASRAQTRQAMARYFATLDKPVRAIFVADADLAGDSPDTETVALSDAQTWRQAFERIAARYGKADAIFYLWPLEDPRFISDCAPIVSLLQAAGAVRIVNGPILLAAQGDDGEQRCHWESWTGFERSAVNALANGCVAAVYQVADRQPDSADLAHWAQILWAELQAGSIKSSLYRHGARHGWSLRPAERRDMVPAASALRHGGTYLITGGLGGLGSLFADYLLRTCAANVVLLGRAPLDKARQSKLDAMGRAGGVVLYMQADVSDPARMAACLGALKERFGALHGVIHAAGVESWQSLQATRWTDFAGVLAPKVAGTLVLDRLLQGEPIDFLCHFSSSAAILGDFGGCSYAVGNRFQMAHARLRQERPHGGRTLAINWPLWRDGGMHVGDKQSTQLYLGSTGQRLLEAAEGLAAFDRLLSRPVSQCLVMAGDPVRIGALLKLDGGGDGPAPGRVRAQADARIAAEARAPSASLDPVALSRRIEQDLLRLASELLQVTPDQLALDRNLADFGFDSINLAAFATALSGAYGVEVQPSVFFSYPTLERLAQFFTQNHAAAMQSLHPGTPLTPAPQLQPPAREAAPEPGAVDDAIAVIGMSGRFPGARGIDQLWRILAEGRSVVAPAPPEREGGWSQARDRCGFVPGVSEFDSLFFDISPREADNMDPRQRLLLEESWKALEDAGYGPAQLAAGCIGTFIGVEEGDYHRLARSGEEGEASITSNHNGILAGRIAYFLNLSGPALALNTACSSGLVALHQACQSLRGGECDTAIVGVANLLLTPDSVSAMRDAGMLAPEGMCYAFDARANGMVPGEAAVVLILKRAALARQDGDRIHALIAASGINSDGRTNGITAPNGAAQARLIESVYRRHHIDPGQIGYVIAHGTGTKLGDPVEVNALIEAFGAFPACAPRAGYCALTSNKPNFGHTLAASGLLSVVCMIEAMRHETIPASLNWERPNPFIQWPDSPFFVNTTTRHWAHADRRARLGAVSAFGMSGTNAHVVLQQYVEPQAVPPCEPPPAFLFVLSAKSAPALQSRRADLAAMFEAMTTAAGPRHRLADICHTLLERRHHLSHRCALVAGSALEAAAMLRADASTPALHYCQGKVARDFRPQAAQEARVASLLAQCAPAGQPAAQLRESLSMLAELYCQGVGFLAGTLLGDTAARLVSLPSYPFTRARHWIRQARSAAVPVIAAPAPPPAAASTAPDPGAHEGAGTMLLFPVWDRAVPAQHAASALPQGRLLLIGGSRACVDAARQVAPQAVVLPADALTDADALARQLERQDGFGQVVWLVAPQPAVPDQNEAAIAAQEQGVLSGFRLISVLLTLGYGARSLDFTVITVRAQSIGAGDTPDAAHASVHGLVGSLAKECPNWNIRLADLPAHDAVSLPEVLSLRPDRRGHAWVYRHGQWYRRHLAPVRPHGQPRAPYRNRGVYIVIGGAGDIGQAWSAHLVRHHQARIVWVGRRERDAAIDAGLARLAALGPAPLYFSADASSLESLDAVRTAVLARHGAVHGVIHAAMVFANQELASMTEPEFGSVLRAKVDVSVRIAQVFGRDALDFLLFFSSMVSLIKNPRQAHYAAGCAFKDAFARQLAHRVAYPVKVVNWGYWGVQKNANASEVRRLADLGLGLIDAEDGMKALDVLLGSPLHQLAVMHLTRALEVEGMDARETIDLYPH